MRRAAAASNVVPLPLLACICVVFFLLAVNLSSSNKTPVAVQSSTASDVPTHCTAALRFLPLDRSKVTVLASYPGSGNTWLRHLIQQGTRVHTGSVYNDASLKQEYPGEGIRDSTVVVAKTHFPCGGCWNVNGQPATERQTGRLDGRTILLLRNPFHAILSEFNRKQSGLNHTGVIAATLLTSPEFEAFVRFRVPSWRRHTQWYQQLADVFVVPYERLVAQPRDELIRIFAFLKQRRPLALKNLQPAIAADCALGKDAQGHFRRDRPKLVDPFQWTPPGAHESLRAWACRELAGVWDASAWGACLVDAATAV